MAKIQRKIVAGQNRTLFSDTERAAGELASKKKSEFSGMMPKKHSKHLPDKIT